MKCEIKNIIFQNGRKTHTKIDTGTGNGQNSK